MAQRISAALAEASTQLENAATVLQPSSTPVTITQLNLLFDGIENASRSIQSAINANTQTWIQICDAHAGGRDSAELVAAQHRLAKALASFFPALASHMASTRSLHRSQPASCREKQQLNFLWVIALSSTPLIQSVQMVNSLKWEHSVGSADMNTAINALLVLMLAATREDPQLTIPSPLRGQRCKDQLRRICSYQLSAK